MLIRCSIVYWPIFCLQPFVPLSLYFPILVPHNPPWLLTFPTFASYSKHPLVNLEQSQDALLLPINLRLKLCKIYSMTPPSLFIKWSVESLSGWLPSQPMGTGLLLGFPCLLLFNTTCFNASALYINIYITESQNGCDWQGPMEVTWSKPLLKQGHTAQGAQSNVQAAFEDFQGGRPHNLSG